MLKLERSTDNKTNGELTNGESLVDNSGDPPPAKKLKRSKHCGEGVMKKKKKYGSLFGAGDPLRSHANVQAELRPMAHLLYNLGLGLVRENVYAEIIENKKNCVEMNDKEISHRDKMIKSHQSLVDKNDIFPKPQKSSEKNYKAFKDEFIKNNNKNVSSCALCDESFNGNSKNFDFAIHMIQVHRRKPRKHPESLKYKCNLCNYESSVRKTFNRHTKRCCAKFNLKLNLRQNPSDYELPVSLQKNYPKSTLLLSGNKPPQHNPQLTSKNVSVPSHSMNKHASNGPNQGQIVSVQGKLYTIIFRGNQKLLAPIRNHKPTKDQMNNIVVINSKTKDGRIQLQNQVAPPGIRPMYHQANQSNNANTASKFSGINNKPFSFSVKPTPNTGGPPQKMMVTSNKSLLHHQHPEAGLVSSATHQAYIAKSAKSTKSALEICEICGGYVKDRHSLRTHFFYAHKLDVIGISYPNRQPNLQCVKCIKKFWTIEGRTKHETIHNQADDKSLKTPINLICTKCKLHFISTRDFKRHNDICLKNSPIVID